MRGLAAILWWLVVQTALFAAEPPARLLDLSCWKLTLPVSTTTPEAPGEIGQPELDSFQDAKHFFVNTTGTAVVFRAPCGGITTKGSGYPRCELREMSEHGNARAAWTTDDATIHAMTARLAVTNTPPIKKHVVCAQIHDENNDLLMIRLEGRKLLIQRHGQESVVLTSDYTLGTPFDLKIQATNGHVRVWYNGVLSLDWSVSKSGCYFKAGCYTQSNRDRGDAPESYGEVIVYRLAIDHQERP